MSEHIQTNLPGLGRPPGGVCLLPGLERAPAEMAILSSAYKDLTNTTLPCPVVGCVGGGVKWSETARDACCLKCGWLDTRMGETGRNLLGILQHD